MDNNRNHYEIKECWENLFEKERLVIWTTSATSEDEETKGRP